MSPIYAFSTLVPAGEMPDLLAAADVVLVTLKMHIPGAVPSKLYEAMASGRPVVLVASGEAAEIVREHRAGIVVEPGNYGPHPNTPNLACTAQPPAHVGRERTRSGRTAL